MLTTMNTEPEPQATARRAMIRTQRRGIWIAAAGAILIAVIVGGLLIASQLDKAEREAGFLATLRADPTTTVGDLPDEQLLVSFRTSCKEIADGRTLGDELTAAHTNWPAIEGTSSITFEEYLANVQALYTAANANC